MQHRATFNNSRVCSPFLRLQACSRLSAAASHFRGLFPIAFHPPALLAWAFLAFLLGQAAIVLAGGSWPSDLGMGGIAFLGAITGAGTIGGASKSAQQGEPDRLRVQEPGDSILGAFLDDPALEDAVLAVDAEGTIVGHNPAAVRLFGNAAPLKGQRVEDILPFVTGSDEVQLWHGAIQGAGGRWADLTVSRAVPNSSPTPSIGPAPFSAFYLIHDISRYTELERLREQLLYNIAHELRGPLSVLNNTFDILASEHAELSEQDVGHLLSNASSTTNRLSSLMENLLSAGSIQAGRFQVRPWPTDLISIVDGAFEVVLPVFNARGQRLESDIPDVVVLADARHLQQVFTNLLTNASKYSPDGSTVSVRAVLGDGLARVAVIDRGDGIPPEQQEGIFERFYRVRPKGEQPGVGLGLAIAKEIIEAHGGTIGIDSAAGVGTTLWFTLSLAHETP